MKHKEDSKDVLLNIAYLNYYDTSTSLKNDHVTLFLLNLSEKKYLEYQSAS